MRLVPLCRGGVAAALALLVCAATAAQAAPAPQANPIQRENLRPGSTGWEIPPGQGAGTVITGYASETSVTPGQSFHLHVSAPAGSRYRIVLYRLGWYGGLGGRRIACVPGCGSSRAAVTQPPDTPPAPRSGLYHAPWRQTDVIPIPRDAVSGYYEAKLELVSGPDTGALGSVPLIVRDDAGHAAVLVEVPVNTWEAYNPWGGRSLYGSGDTHATEVSFDRPYDQQELYEMSTRLELPWVRFLERRGVDVSYQTDVDTDRNPGSLLRHRLVFAIGHDEYWTQRMRDAFDRARALGTNLMVGSNSGLWRIRYGAGSDRRTVVEWRNPYVDPVHDWRYDTGSFQRLGDPGCRLMAVQYEEYAQRPITQAPTSYTVSGPADDPWLAAAGLKPGDVVPGVVGYEWDSLIPGCFPGRVVSLMHAEYPGPDGVLRSADMVRATARSGARVFAMGTMELAFALDRFSGESPDPRVTAFVDAALADLLRPAPPIALRAHRARRAGGTGRAGRMLVLSARLAAPDPRVLRVSVQPVGGDGDGDDGVGGGCVDALHAVCRVPLPRRPVRYAAVAVDRWGRSEPLVVTIAPR